MSRKLIESIEINNFSEYIKKVNKVRPKPYIKDKCRLPKKYSSDEYEWRKIKYWGKVIEVRFKKGEGSFLISNSKSANKEKFVKVNGQDIYNQRDNSFGRAFLKNFLTDFYIPYIEKIDKIEELDCFPLCIEMLFYMHDMGKRNIDNDNKWVWEKGFQDALVKMDKIIDDNPHIISRNEKETIFIPDDEEQKLIINIYGRGIN